MTEEKKEEKTYKNRVVFLRKSKRGAHLYAFNREGILGGGVTGAVESLLMDVSEVERLIAGSTEWIKVSVISAGDTEKE